MRSKLSTLGLVLILSALIFSGCAPPTARPSEVEYCLDKDAGTRLSYHEATEIAQDSECLEHGQLKETRFCNEDTGTWWIDLDVDNPGCNPACVVDVSDETAEINWRCTGAISDVTVEAPEPSVTISPTSGPSGTLVQVVASGFPPNTPVSVGVGPVNSQFSEVARGTTDGSGVFTVEVPVQGAPGMALVFAVAAEGQPGVSSPDLFHITE